MDNQHFQQSTVQNQSQPTQQATRTPEIFPSFRHYQPVQASIRPADTEQKENTLTQSPLQTTGDSAPAAVQNLQNDTSSRLVWHVICKIDSVTPQRVTPQRVTPQKLKPLDRESEVPFLIAWSKKKPSPSMFEIDIYVDKLNCQRHRESEPKVNKNQVQVWFERMSNWEEPFGYPEKDIRLIWDPLLINDLQILRKVNCPNLDPVLEGSIELIDQLSSWRFPDPLHLALDFLQGSPEHPVRLDFPPSEPPKNAEELVLLSNFSLVFSNKWKRTDLLVDYETIRFSNWNPRWPLSRRLALSLSERLSLRKVKICSDSLKMEESSKLFVNLTLLKSLEDLEINVLIVDARKDDAPQFKFDSLRLLSIGSVKVIHTDAKKVSKRPKIVAYKLNWVFLFNDSAEKVAFAQPCHAQELVTFQIPEENLLRTTFSYLKVFGKWTFAPIRTFALTDSSHNQNSAC